MRFEIEDNIMCLLFYISMIWGQFSCTKASQVFAFYWNDRIRKGKETILPYENLREMMSLP